MKIVDPVTVTPLVFDFVKETKVWYLGTVITRNLESFVELKDLRIDFF